VIDKQENEKCGETFFPILENSIESEPNQWPWIAELQVGTSHCSGTLVHSEWVLTSAQCTLSKKASSFSIRLGEYDLTSDDYTEQQYKGSAIEIHPDYYPYSIESDVSLIKLDVPAKLDRYVKTACLPQANNSITKDSRCHLSGWGTGSYKQHNHVILKQIRLWKISHPKCRKDMKHFDDNLSITYNMICAGSHSNNTECIADIGSPLVCNHGNKKFILNGYASWIDTKCDEKLNVFTNIAKYIDWIETIIYSKYI